MWLNPARSEASRPGDGQPSDGAAERGHPEPVVKALARDAAGRPDRVGDAAVPGTKHFIPDFCVD
jgi:hypothetical protein